MTIRDLNLLELVEIYTATRRLLGDDSVEAKIFRREIERRDRAVKDANRETAKREGGVHV